MTATAEAAAAANSGSSGTTCDPHPAAIGQHHEWCDTDRCEISTRVDGTVTETFHRSRGIGLSIECVAGEPGVVTAWHSLAQGGGLPDEEGVCISIGTTVLGIHSPDEVERLGDALLEIAARYRDEIGGADR